MRSAALVICLLFVSPALAEEKLTPDQLAAAFDTMWSDMDLRYSYFDHKKIDWAKFKATHRDAAIKAGTREAFIAKLQAALTELKDMHIWIEADGKTLPTYQRGSTRDFNVKAILAAIDKPVQCGRFAMVASLRGTGLGYMLVNQQGAANDENVKLVIDEIRKRDAAGATGFIIDLRGATGGNEIFAQQIAQIFCEKDMVYARSKYRSGAKHDEFGQSNVRVLKAAGNDAKPITKPIVCLIGGAAMSSGEGWVLMMKALPHVKLVGNPTRGASGNPSPVELPHVNVKVWYSRWVAMDGQGNVIEDAGVKPDVQVKAKPEDFNGGNDPVLEKGIAVLKEMVGSK